MTALRPLPCACLKATATASLVSIVEGREIVRCENCGLLHTAHAPLNPLALYLDGYHAQAGAGKIPYVERFNHDVNVGRLRLRAHGGQFREVLDVGAANGGFLRACADAGIPAWGIEPNEAMARYAMERSDRPVFSSFGALDGALGSRKFDLITYHDVIEHIADPNEEIQRARRFLRASGVLALDTPDADHPLLYERHLKPEEHLWFFGERQLRDLLRRNEMHVARVERPIPGKLVAYATRRSGG